MMGWIERVLQNIKDLYGLDFNPERFDYMRTEPRTRLVQKWDWERLGIVESDIKSIWFVYEILPQKKRIIVNFPYQHRFDFQKFLNSGKIEDLPEDYIGKEKYEDIIFYEKK